MFNGPIHVPCRLMSIVVASATEAESCGLFVNTQDGAPERTTLTEMGHEQEETPVETDNLCAVGIANKTVKMKRSKAMDMRFNWVRCRVKQKQFLIYWKKGADNIADYFTKHHPAEHHRKMRAKYIHKSNSAVTIHGEGVFIPASAVTSRTKNHAPIGRAVTQCEQHCSRASTVRFL